MRFYRNRQKQQLLQTAKAEEEVAAAEQIVSRAAASTSRIEKECYEEWVDKGKRREPKHRHYRHDRRKEVTDGNMEFPTNEWKIVIADTTTMLTMLTTTVILKENRRCW